MNWSDESRWRPFNRHWPWGRKAVGATGFYRSRAWKLRQAAGGTLGQRIAVPSPNGFGRFTYTSRSVRARLRGFGGYRPPKLPNGGYSRAIQAAFRIICAQQDKRFGGTRTSVIRAAERSA